MHTIYIKILMICPHFIESAFEELFFKVSYNMLCVVIIKISLTINEDCIFLAMHSEHNSINRISFPSVS